MEPALFRVPPYRYYTTTLIIGVVHPFRCALIGTISTGDIHSFECALIGTIKIIPGDIHPFGCTLIGNNKQKLGYRTLVDVRPYR